LRYIGGGLLLGTILGMAGLFGLYLAFRPPPPPAISGLPPSSGAGDKAVPTDTVSKPSPTEKAIIQFKNSALDDSRVVMRKGEPRNGPASDIAAVDPFAEMPGDKRLQLPPLPAEGEQAQAPAELVRLVLGSPVECRLALFDVERTSAETGIFSLQLGPPEDVIPEKTRRWPVTRTTKSNLGEETLTLGHFALTGHSLSFAWNPERVEMAQLQTLQFCILEITIGQIGQRCSLLQPIAFDAVRLELKKPRFEVELPRAIAGLEGLQFEIWLEGLAGPVKKQKLAIDSTVKLSIDRLVQDNQDKNVHVDLQIALKQVAFPNKGYRLMCEASLMRPQIRINRSRSGKVDGIDREDVSAPAVLGSLEEEIKQNRAHQSKIRSEHESLRKSRERKEKIASKQRQNISKRKNLAKAESSGILLTEDDEDDDGITARLQELEAFRDTLNDVNDWYRHILTALEALQAECRIGLEVYCVNHGVRVMVLSTPTPAADSSEE
jgi:hypothetical protein